MKGLPRLGAGVRSGALVLSLTMLAGCGMKGPLYHPQPDARPASPSTPAASTPGQHAHPATGATSSDRP